MLVDDDYIDVMTVQRAMNDSAIEKELIIAGNGEEALEILRSENSQKPCIILLDINMPIMNGIEFLKEIKADDDLKSIPAIILSTSRHDQDKVASFNLSIAAYMVKPSSYPRFVEMFRRIKDYWQL